MLIADVLRSKGHDVVKISPADSVALAVRKLAEHRIGALVVVEGQTVSGIVSERDIVRGLAERGASILECAVREVMTSPVETVSDSTSVAEAASIMHARHIRHLAIVDGKGHFLGLVAQRYLLYNLLSDLEVKVDSLEGFIMADGPGG